MPAAELFGTWTLVEAVAAKKSRPPRAVIAVGDCDPAALAINATSSEAAAMRALLAHARRLTIQWLAVAVPREANVDADRLSHPRLLGAVEADVRAAGGGKSREGGGQEEMHAAHRRAERLTPA
eukprot:1262726-Pleurochrysis_carterae.AAC.1